MVRRLQCSRYQSVQMGLHVSAVGDHALVGSDPWVSIRISLSSQENNELHDAGSSLVEVWYRRHFFFVPNNERGIRSESQWGGVA
jgi:hypothetical protein